MAEVFAAYPDMPFVLDPVMVAKGGHNLLEPDAVSSLKSLLLPLASLITPNVPEAEALSGMEIASLDDQFRAADALLRLGARAVLLKGGHMDLSEINDVLASSDGVSVLPRPRQATAAHPWHGVHAGQCDCRRAGARLVLAEAVRRHIFMCRRRLPRPRGLVPGMGRLIMRRVAGLGDRKKVSSF